MEVKTIAIGPVSNSYLIKADKGYVQVDSGCYATEEEIRKVYEDAGVDPKDVKLIILTHGHFDHAGDLDVVQKITGAPVLCHEKALEFIKTGVFAPYVARNEHGQMFIDQVANPAPVQTPGPVDVEIVVGDEDYDLSAFGIKAKVVYAPGHVPSNISVICDDGDAFVGDAILGDPFGDLKCSLALLADDKEALFKSTERIIKEAKKIYCGHFGPFTVDEVKAAYETAKAE